MVIKNKDGNVYRLQGPNPFMQNQELWEEYVKHNFEWKDEIVFDFLKQKLNLPQTYSSENFLEEIEKSKEEPKFQDPVQNIQPQIQKSEKIKNKENLNIETTECFCLPAIISESHDDLYGEIKKTIKYGERFLFEIVALEQNDLTFRWWSTKEIDKGSIIYPKNREKRWWKVTEIKQAPQGFIYLSMPSEFTPSFV